MDNGLGHARADADAGDGHGMLLLERVGLSIGVRAAALAGRAEGRKVPLHAGCGGAHAAAASPAQITA